MNSRRYKIMAAALATKGVSRSLLEDLNADCLDAAVARLRLIVVLMQWVRAPIIGAWLLRSFFDVPLWCGAIVGAITIPKRPLLIPFWQILGVVGAINLGIHPALALLLAWDVVLQVREFVWQRRRNRVLKEMPPDPTPDPPSDPFYEINAILRDYGAPEVSPVREPKPVSEDFLEFLKAKACWVLDEETKRFKAQFQTNDGVCWVDYPDIKSFAEHYPEAFPLTK